MWLVAQGVDDPDVEPGERREALRRQSDQVAGVGEPAEAEAERGDVAMLLQDGQGSEAAPCPFDPHRLTGSYTMLARDRRILAAGRRHKAIAEALVERLRGRRVHIDWNALAAVNEQAAQVVDAVSVVGVLMGIKHGVDPIDVGVKQLLAQIRRRVDQDAGYGRAGTTLDQQRSAASTVPGIVWIAVAPAE